VRTDRTAARDSATSAGRTTRPAGVVKSARWARISGSRSRHRRTPSASTVHSAWSCRGWSTRTTTRTRTGSAACGTTCRSSRGCFSRTRPWQRRRNRL